MFEELSGGLEASPPSSLNLLFGGFKGTGKKKMYGVLDQNFLTSVFFLTINNKTLIWIQIQKAWIWIQQNALIRIRMIK
jgi:hypothetical protein